MQLQTIRVAAALLMLSGASAGQAHMPYVLPTLFDVGKGDHVTVQSAFAEDIFLPEVPMRDAPFHLIGPDGVQLPVEPVTHLRDLSIFEANLPAQGTYRVTSGQRAGRKGKMFRINDDWVVRGEGGETPANTQPVDVQSMTLAEAYVTRGQPTSDALKAKGEALEVQPVTHPNDIAAGSDATFTLLFNGQPLANTEVTLFRSAGYYDGRKISSQTKSDANGRFSVKPDDAGTYLILARHRDVAPAGAATPYRSYTYTLVFDAS